MNLSQQVFGAAAQHQQQQEAQQSEISRDRFGNQGYIPRGTSAADLERLLGVKTQQLG